MVFSGLYQNLIDRAKVLLPNHDHLPNSVDLGRNNKTWLAQGFAVRVGSAENAELSICPRTFVNQFVTVRLTREVYAQEHDVDTRLEPVKELLDDAQVLFDDAVENFQISGVTKVDFDGYEAPDFIFDDSDAYWFLDVNFTIGFKAVP